MNIGLISKSKDEDAIFNQFQSLDKAGVLQEVRTFNKSAISPKTCLIILNKLIYLLNHGYLVNTNEATDAFFAATKLFQSQDIALRRMVYVVIRELATLADDVIIVTSSLTKDLTGKQELLRSGALRALCTVIDPSMIQSIERYMKQAIVDKNPSVSSAALVSSYHLLATSTDFIKRWGGEIQEASSHDQQMIQYHATGLLYKIRKHDKLAVSKLVTKLSKSTRSPHACCLLIRIISRHSPLEATHQDFIESCLHNKNEMVVYEAACAIIRLKQNQGSREIQSAISVLSVFLSSPKAVLKYAATKTLSRVAMEQPGAVTICNLDLENLVQDPNRSIATLAITTLLKTGTEASVERLMKQIAKFMGEIPDEFKVVVMKSIQSLCQKFHKKHQLVMSHLSSWLREEGGYEYKKAIVTTLLLIIDSNPEMKEIALAHLCEFIEDCEHSDLACEVLRVIGREGPKASNPRTYIQYVYNRVLLESPQVRAAAISVLGAFGSGCPALLPSVVVLLERCLLDDDNLVRDRASMLLAMLSGENGTNLINDGLQVSLFALEYSLLSYTSRTQLTAFSLKSIPLETEALTEHSLPDITGEKEPSTVPVPQKETTLSKQDQLFAQLGSIPELSELGPVFKSSHLPIELTESETEYVVHCTKHMFSQHIVFQFDCTNTLSDQYLENVYIQMECQGDGFEMECYVPCPALPYNKPGTSYCCFRLPDDKMHITATFSNTLKFSVRDCDPTTGEPSEAGYEEEYVLEDISMDLSDHIQGLIRPSFSSCWDQIGAENQIEETMVLSQSNTVQEAINQLITFLSMTPCEKSNVIDSSKTSHILLLSGVFRGGHDVLIRAKLIQSNAVNMQMVVRSPDIATCDLVAQSLVG